MRSIRLVLIVTATLVLHGAAAVGQTQARPSQTGGAEVSGAVKDRQTGSALRKALVRLASIDRKDTRTALTDANGRFRFEKVVPGKYLLATTKGGYVPTTFGQKRPFTQGTPVEVIADRKLEVSIELSTGASIDGIVVDEFGEPVADAVVMTLRNQYVNGRRRLVAVGRALTTNDRGEFRLFGLPDGAYLVSVSPTLSNTSEGGDKAGFAPTYYPNSTDATSAEVVTLEAGERRINVIVSLATVTFASVSGNAYGANGQPLTTGSVVATNRSAGVPLVVGTTTIKADGAFVLDGLAPGKLILTAASTMTPAPGISAEIATAEVDLAGGDIVGLRLAVPAPAYLSGRVSLNGDEPPPTGLHVRVRSAIPSDVSDRAATLLAVHPDGRFEGRVPAGQQLLDVVGLPASQFVRAVRARDADVSDDGVGLAEGETLGGISILLTRQPTVVSGRAVKHTSDYSVIVFSTDRERWQFRSRYVGTARSRADGTFEIKGLPAGEYFVAGVDYIEQGEDKDPVLLGRLSDQALRIQLIDAEEVQVAVPVVRR